MLTYKLDGDPYDSEIMFTGRLERNIPSGLTVLVGCNGSGKTTTLDYIKDAYKKNKSYKIFSWDGTKDKRDTRDSTLYGGVMDVFATIFSSSEGEEININIGLLAQKIGAFIRGNADKDIIVLLDALDSGLSVDNIVETKRFFKELVIPDVEKMGHKCYVIASANEYELARGERCIDARSGKEISFESYEEYRKYILGSRKKKDKRAQTR